jgi:hypothetical protein
VNPLQPSDDTIKVGRVTTAIIPALSDTSGHSTNEAPAPAVRDIHEEWDKMVSAVREVMIKARANKSPLEDPIPGNFDEFGRPLRYLRYALDRYGRLSTGHKKGRIHKHWSKNQLAIKSRALEIFREKFSAYVDEMRREDAKDGKEFQGITSEEIAPIGAFAAKHGARQIRRNRRTERAARRARQKASRRVNFGLIQGNQARAAHANG